MHSCSGGHGSLSIHVYLWFVAYILDAVGGLVVLTVVAMSPCTTKVRVVFAFSQLSPTCFQWMLDSTKVALLLFVIFMDGIPGGSMVVHSLVRIGLLPLGCWLK